MYYGNFSKIKSFDDVISSVKRFCFALSALFFCFYIWGSFISPPIEYSELTELEGVVIEKWLQTPAKSAEQYRLRVKTEDGVKQVHVGKKHVENCFFLEEIPLNKKVSLLTNWSIEGINLYQLTFGDKVLLDAHNVLARQKEDITNYLPFSLALFSISGFAYCVGAVRKTKKST